jgi:hypothetical protein
VEQLPLTGAAEWVARLPEDEETQRRRSALLEALDGNRFAALDERVGLVLKDFPETRDSDTELVLRFWQRFESETLRAWIPNRSLDVLHDLERVDSITRSRRRIQNDLHLFEPTEWTKAQRQENQRDFLQYLSYQRDSDPELRFYLDETGSHGGEFVGVGGICIIDWGTFEPHFAAMQAWRKDQGWPHALHFADLRDEDADKYISLLRQVLGRKAVVLFVAHGLPERAVKHESLFLLFVHLVLDSLEMVARLGCLQQPRAVRVIKEQDTGFDRVKLDRLEELLAQQIVHEFPGRAYLRKVESVAKGSDVLIECADVIASAVRRRLLYDTTHAKDLVSATVMKETGLESFGSNSGAVFKIHGLGPRA